MKGTTVLLSPKEVHSLGTPRAHLSTCSNWSSWLRAAPEILLNKVIKYCVLKTGKGKMEWEPLVSFINDYTQPFDAFPFHELNGCSMNKLRAVRLWEQPEMKMCSCRICWSHIKKEKAGEWNIFLKKIRIRIQKCHVSVLCESWYVTLPILPSGLGFQTNPIHPFLGRCTVISPKERDCPRRIRKNPQTYREIWHHAIALPKLRVCLSRWFLFYTVLLLKT